MYTDPYLLAPVASSMNVLWLTSEKTDNSYVEYGPTEGYGSTQIARTYDIKGMKTVDSYSADLAVYQEIAEIGDLKPGPRYFYRVVSETESGRKASDGSHSHVWERYLVNGVNYIEAATIGNNYPGANDPLGVAGYRPVFEENRFRSVMVASIDPKDGMVAKGIQTSVEADGVGAVGRVFGMFTVAPAGNRGIRGEGDISPEADVPFSMPMSWAIAMSTDLGGIA